VSALTGATRSRTIWLNVIIAMLAGLELAGAHLTTLLGPQVAAAILLASAVANMALRAVTTMPLSER